MVWLLFSVILCLFAAISLSDIRYMLIPLYFSLPLLLIAIIYANVRGTGVINILISAAAGFLFIVLIRLLTKKGIGFGDAILSSAIAVILGISYWLPAMTSASLLALIYIGATKYIKKADITGMRIPFAPFMSVAAIIFMLIAMFHN